VLPALLLGVLLSPPLDASYPPDPTGDLEWPYNSDSTVAQVQARFNAARTNENSQLGTSVPVMALPSQSAWDAMTDGEKALWLINQERLDRGVYALHGLEANVASVAQYYADYLMANNVFGHYEDGLSPWDRLNTNPAINGCRDFLPVAENLSVFWGGWTLPVERSVYIWIYDDSSSAWGHRHAILWYPYNDNGGPIGVEGFLGLGHSTGTHQGWSNSDIFVMNVFDPCATWIYGEIFSDGFETGDLTRWSQQQ